MGAKKDITPKKSSVIVAYAKDGLSYSEIARKVSVSKSAVGKVIKRYNETGGVSRSVGSGRPRITSKRLDNTIRRAAIKNPFITSNEIAASLPSPVSARTIRRRLLVDFKLPCRRPSRKPLLTKTQRMKRLQFCKQ